MDTDLQLPDDILPDQINQTEIDIAVHETANRQPQVLESLAAAVYTCDSAGYIKSYNKAAVDLWGREPQIGKDLWCGSWKIFQPDGITAVPLDTCPMAIAVKEGHAVRGHEIIVERPDGLRRNVMPYPDPIFNRSGDVVEAVNMLVDITDLKQKEKALQESEDRYKRLAKELEAALKIEEEFMSIASHELKTPITSIKLFIEVLLEQANAVNADQKAKHMLSRVQIQVEKLSSLVQELLDATKLRSGELDLNLEEVSLNQMMKELANDVTSTTNSHNFQIHESGNVQVRCDKHRLEQVISNLLSNAVKYSKAGSTVNITIAENKETVHVSIRDEGKGIPPELMYKIFDRFFRANKEDVGMLSSVGLGLFISKDIINRHYGTIWVESKVNEGSTFHFTLPKV